MPGKPVAKFRLEQGRAFLAYVWKRFVDDRCPGIAATLSYTSLLALVPLAAIWVAIMAVFPVFEGLRRIIRTFVFENFIPDTGEQIAEYFEFFVNNADSLTTIGIGGLAVTAILLLATIESTFNTVFRVSRRRRFVPRFLALSVVLALGPLAVGASFSLAANISALAEWAGGGTSTWPSGPLAPFTHLLVVMAALSLFYVIIPNRTVEWRHAIAGGAVAGILFSMLRWGFGIYIAYYPTYRTIYGALSAVPVFLVWMYCSWAVVLFGAVVTASFSEWRDGE